MTIRYDINGGNEESSIVNAIDASLTKEVFDPATDEYWDELTERARRLPEKFEDFVEEVGKQEEPTPVKKKRVVVVLLSDLKEHAPASRKEVYISPERKQAMMDHGVWDDQVLRQVCQTVYGVGSREQGLNRLAFLNQLIFQKSLKKERH